MKKETLFLFLILLGGALYRIGYVLEAHIDSDQAIFGLTGWHVLKGEFPIFQWGYHYLGTLQTYVDAAFFALFGLNRYTLNSVPVFFSLIFTLTTYFLAKEILGDKKAGLVAALLTAFGPYFLVLHGAWARHGYLETLIFGNVLLLLTTKIVYTNPMPEQKKNYFIWFGLIAGVAWWTNFLILYYFIACALFLFWHDKKIFFKKDFYRLLGFFFLGSLPFWIDNVTHHFASLEMFLKESETADFKKALSLFATAKLPTLLGIRPLSPLFWKIMGWVFFSFTALWLLTRKHPKPFWLLLVLSLTVIYLQSASLFGVERTERYLLPLYSTLPLFLARAFQTLKEKNLWLGYGFLGLILTLHFHDNSLSYPLIQTERREHIKQDMATKKKMKQSLLDQQIYGAYTYDYWVGPLMTFDCSEEILFPHPFLERYPLYTRKVDALWKAAYLSVGESKPLEDVFHTLNASFKRFNAPPFDFYSSFEKNGAESEEIPPTDWKVSASSRSEIAGRAADNNLRSVWMSPTQQLPGMTFTIELLQAEKIGKIEYFIGHAYRGIPKEMKLLRSLDGKNWEEATPLASMSNFFWDGTHPFDHGIYDRRELNLDGKLTRFLRFELTKPHQKQPDYWAFAEICLYRNLERAHRSFSEEEIDILVKKLFRHKNCVIYPTVWLSAYLCENYPKLSVANIWQAPIDEKIFKHRILNFTQSMILVAPDETAAQVERELTESQIPFKIEKSPPFTLYATSPIQTERQWYWSGKHLFQWKRIAEK